MRRSSRRKRRRREGGGVHFLVADKYIFTRVSNTGLYSLSPLSGLLCRGEIYPQPRPNTPS